MQADRKGDRQTNSTQTVMCRGEQRDRQTKLQFMKIIFFAEFPSKNVKCDNVFGNVEFGQKASVSQGSEKKEKKVFLQIFHRNNFQ